MSTPESRLPAISSFAASATAMIWANGAPTRMTGADMRSVSTADLEAGFCRRKGKPIPQHSTFPVTYDDAELTYRQRGRRMPADRPITCQALPSGSAAKRVPAFDLTRNNSVCLPSLRASAICVRTSVGLATRFAAHAILLRRVCIQTEFDVARVSISIVAAARASASGWNILADDRVDGSAPCHCIDCRPHQGRRGGAKRAADLLDVDDVGPVLDGDLRPFTLVTLASIKVINKLPEEG